MAQTWLIPATGLRQNNLDAQQLEKPPRPRGYLRLPGISTAGLEQADDGGLI